MPESQQGARIPIIHDPGDSFSPKRYKDYLRLLKWIFWFPQGLKFYIQRYPEPNNRHRQNLLFMTVILSGLLMWTAAACITVVLGSTQGNYVTLWPEPHIWWIALMLASLTAISTTGIAIFFGKVDSQFVVSPTGGVLGVVMFYVIFRNIQQPTFVWMDECVGYGIAGAFSGLIYSQASAYFNYGLPYWGKVLVAGFAFSISSLCIALLTSLLVPRSELMFESVLYGIVAIIASFIGFLLIAPRYENWLYGWMRTFQNSDLRYETLPSVTFVTIPGLKDAIRRISNKDWQEAMAESKVIWLYTRQHRAVTQALYESLVNTEQPVLNERMLTLAKDMPWVKTQWLIDGGKREAAGLLADALGKTLRTYRDQSVVNAALLSIEYCKQAAVKEAIDVLAKQPQSSQRVLGLTQILAALRALADVPGPIGHGDPPHLDIPLQASDPIWLMIGQMLDVYQYAWLAYRCQTRATRHNAIDLASDALAVVENRIKSDAQIEVEKQCILLFIIGKWSTDLKSMKIEDIRPLGFVSPRTQNPFNYDEPIRIEEKLVGRKPAIKNLNKAWSGSHFQVTEVTGPVLAGKTSLFLAVSSNYKAAIPNTVVAYISLRHLNTDVKATVRIANALYDELGEAVNEIPSTDVLSREPLRVLERMIREICETNDKHLLIGLDDIDYLEEIIEIQNEFERFLRFIFHLNEIIPNFGVVLIGSVDHGLLYRRYRPKTTRFAKPIRIGAIGSDANQSSLVELLNYPSQFFPHRFTKEAIARILFLTGGQVYLVQLVAWNVYEQFDSKYTYYGSRNAQNVPLSTHDPLFTVEDVDGIFNMWTFKLGIQYYLNRLGTYFGDDWRAVQEILDLFVHANGSLSQAAIRAYFDVHEPGLDPRKIIDSLKKLQTQQVLYPPQKEKYSLRIWLLQQVLGAGNAKVG